MANQARRGIAAHGTTITLAVDPLQLSRLLSEYQRYQDQFVRIKKHVRNWRLKYEEAEDQLAKAKEENERLQSKLRHAAERIADMQRTETAEMSDEFPCMEDIKRERVRKRLTKSGQEFKAKPLPPEARQIPGTGPERIQRLGCNALPINTAPGLYCMDYEDRQFSVSVDHDRQHRIVEVRMDDPQNGAMVRGQYASYGQTLNNSSVVVRHSNRVAWEPPLANSRWIAGASETYSTFWVLAFMLASMGD